MNRCEWASNDLLIKYHDKEWGVPLHNDRKLFEFLVLDGMQAGLSWHTLKTDKKAQQDLGKSTYGIIKDLFWF